MCLIGQKKKVVDHDDHFSFKVQKCFKEVSLITVCKFKQFYVSRNANTVPDSRRDRVCVEQVCSIFLSS